MASLKLKEVICLLYAVTLFISGAVLIGFSIVSCYRIFVHFTFIPNETIIPFVVIILVGIAHLFITWVGVIGPSKEHDFFIIMIVIFAIIMLLIEWAVGIYSIVLMAKVGDKSLELMKESQNKYREQWNSLESMLECCGINNSTDYGHQESFPFSCFKCNDKDITKKISCQEPQLHQIGCGGPTVEYIKKLLLKASITGFVSGTLQIVGIAAFIIFYKALKEERVTRAANRASRLRQSMTATSQWGQNRNNPAQQTPSAPT